MKLAGFPPTNPSPKGTDRSRFLHRPALILIAISACLLAWAYFRRDSILNAAGRSIICSEAPRRADLILVLGGDFWGSRVVKGADLATQGFGPAVLISGPPYRGRPEGEAAINFLVKKGYPRHLFISFEHNSTSTIGEAMALRPELKARRVKQVILVTSAYHSRRAAIVLSLFCPDVHFISVPANDSNYQPESWWKNEKYRQVFFSEWTKILGSVLWVYPKHLLFA